MEIVAIIVSAVAMVLTIGNLYLTDIFWKRYRTEDKSLRDLETSPDVKENDRVHISEDSNTLEVRLFDTDEGSFLFTDAMLQDIDFRDAKALEQDILDEAISRGLEVNITNDFLSGGILVRWRPSKNGRVHER